MSGGHFNYAQYQMNDYADECESLAANYPADIAAKFHETAHWLRRASEMLQRVDWLVSGDDGEESFRKRWKVEVRKP